MALVFNKSGATTKAYFFPSGAVVDFGALSAYEVNDTDVLRAKLEGLKKQEINDMAGALGFVGSIDFKRCTKSSMIEAFVKKWENVKANAGVIATVAVSDEATGATTSNDALVELDDFANSTYNLNDVIENDEGIDMVMDEHSVLQPAKGVLTIVADTIKGKAQFIYHFHEKTNGKHIIDALQDFGLDMNAFKIRAYSSGSYIYPYEPIWANFGAKPVFPLVADMRGGGWMKTKKHLTKIEAMKMLKTRVISNVVGVQDEEITASIPEEIEQYITKVKGVIENISLAKAQNIPIVKTGLKQASDTSLKVALDILTSTSRKGLTEERIGKAISILLPSMVEVATSQEAIGKLHKDLMAVVLGIACDEYGIYADGTAKLGLDDLKQDIKIEYERRQMANSSSAGVEAPNGCYIG